MRGSGSSFRFRLVACLLASVALHAGGAGVVAVQHRANAAAGASLPLPPDQKPPDLGDERGSSASIDWIGFEAPVKQNARESQVNQAALALNAGILGPLLPPVPPSRSPEAEEAAEAVSMAAASLTPPAAAMPFDPSEAADVPLADGRSALGPLLAQIRAVLAARSMRPAAEAQPAPRVEAEEAPTPPAPQAGAALDPGARSDREADAASREPDAQAPLRTGYVVSAAGLEITTRRPQFEVLTRMVTHAANPLVRIAFDRTGRVTDVKLLESSGAKEVDAPVIAAVYNWTAAGAPLGKLPDSDPKATVDVTIRVLLR